MDLRKLFLSLVVSLPAFGHADPLFLAHTMPWYQSKPFSGSWGWHWTMNKFNPDSGDGASRFHPLIGFYDSSDPNVVEYQLLTMKAAGIGGILVDWYGDIDLYDYTFNHKNTLALLKGCEKYGLKFALVYEDQTMPQLIKNKKVTSDYAPDALRGIMQRLEEGMFRSPAYIKEDGHPLFLVFGPQYFHGNEWKAAFKALKTKPAFYTLMDRKAGAVGGYAWPVPQQGVPHSVDEMVRFSGLAKEWPAAIPVAYPRFMDVYAQAGVQPGYPDIPDDQGKTFDGTLSAAQKMTPKYIQLCTWNDWGEGTQIEPSKELGYRALEQVSVAAHGCPPADLDLPYRLFKLRKSGRAPSDAEAAAKALAAGDYAKARIALSEG